MADRRKCQPVLFLKYACPFKLRSEETLLKPLVIGEGGPSAVISPLFSDMPYVSSSQPVGLCLLGHANFLQWLCFQSASGKFLSSRILCWAFLMGKNMEKMKKLNHLNWILDYSDAFTDISPCLWDIASGELHKFWFQVREGSTCNLTFYFRRIEN